MYAKVPGILKERQVGGSILTVLDPHQIGLVTWYPVPRGLMVHRKGSGRL